MKIDIWTLCAVLLCAPLGAQPPAQPPADLLPDAAYGVSSLPRLSSHHAISSFAVLEDAVYFVQHRADEPFRISRLPHRVRGARGGAAEHDILPQCNALFLHRGGDELRFYDAASRSLASYEPLSGRLDLRPAGMSVVSGFAAFADGQVLVYSTALHPRPLSEIELRGLDDVEARALAAEVEELRDSAVFLMDSRFHLVRPLLGHHRPESRARQNDPRRELTVEEAWEDGSRRVFIRMGPSGEVAAVFRRHVEGITLFGPDGSLLGRLVHAGKGVIIPEEGPVPGARAFVQSDVLVAEDHLLVSDPFAGVVRQLDLEGNQLRELRTRWPVMEMQRYGKWLYLRGRSGEFGRFHYPERRGR